MAKEIKANIVNYECVEIDPFILGKVCLLNLKTKDEKRITLILDYDLQIANNNLIPANMEGKPVTVNSNKLTRVLDGQALNELKSYNEKYYYMYAEIDAVTINNSNDSKLEMLKLVKLTERFSAKLPKGYKAIKITKPKMNLNLKSWLDKETRKAKQNWKNYVLESDEFENQTNSSLIQIASAPELYLEVDYVLEINKVYKILNNNILIGYYYEITNWIESTIIQDGAWYEAFLTIDQEIVSVEEETN